MRQTQLHTLPRAPGPDPTPNPDPPPWPDPTPDPVPHPDPTKPEPHPGEPIPTLGTRGIEKGEHDAQCADTGR